MTDAEPFSGSTFGAVLKGLFAYTDDQGIPLLGRKSEFNTNDEGWLRSMVRCPAHSDSQPSLRVNLRSGGIRCFGAGNCFGAGRPNGSTLRDLERFLRARAGSNEVRTSISVGDSVPERMDVGETRRHRRGTAVRSLETFASSRMLDVDLRTHFAVRPVSGGYAYPVDDPDARHAIRVKGGEYAGAKYWWHGSPSCGAAAAIYNRRGIAAVLNGLIFICEGEPDVWAMDAADLGPAVSFLGGAGTLPDERAIGKLLDAGVRRALVLYDWDEAGRRGGEALVSQLHSHGIEARLAARPSALREGSSDIGDLWCDVGGEVMRFREAIVEAAAGFRIEWE